MAETAKPAVLTVPKGADEIRVYSHSNIIYWWPVWVWAGVCWALTAAWNIDINPTGAKVVNVYARPWLGISFLCVLFFVVTFSNIRTRGLHALVIVLAVALIIIGINTYFGLTRLGELILLLEVYANQGFYGAVAVFFFLLWVITVFGVDRLSYVRVNAGQVVQEHRLGHATDVALDTRGMIVRRLPSDFFRHKILGLGIFGVGMGDFICRPSLSSADVLVLENVVGLSRKLPRIEQLISAVKSE